MPQLVNERIFKVYDYLAQKDTVSSQKEFAQVCGFPAPHWNEYKDGARNISLKHITNLYIRFGVSLTYMVIGKEPMMDEDAKKEIEPELLRQLEAERAKRALLEKLLEAERQKNATYQELIEKYLAK